ncbi:hypothetical protein ACIQC8_03545 [Agrococcus sediminis]|uniref:hypothetical protein n=1 Tax=Agrococcus TaxID=46352 RepID=UPI001788A578|nr:MULTISPECIES: hypothetical protein [Agrococcus]UOW00280.1 hypothetical protein MU522_10115 [Agrococcus sp. SCSIO52902]
MPVSRTPAPLWLWIVAAACFAGAALLQEDALTRTLFLVAAGALAVTALLQWRMRRGR